MLDLDKLYNIDCMQGMKEFPDKYFDLAIVDPPYGIGESNRAYLRGGKQCGNSLALTKEYTQKQWDKEPPPAEYFSELMRVSKNQIVFLWTITFCLANTESASLKV